MPDPNDDVFSQIHAQTAAGAARHEEARQAHFEETVVRTILCYTKQDVAKLRQDVRALAGQRDFTLTWFNERFPAFPLVLGTAKIARIQETQFCDWFKRFTKTPLFLAYRAHVTANLIDERKEHVGVVCDWPTIGLVVLHNFPRAGDVSRAENPATEDFDTLLLRAVGYPPMIYCVEQLRSLLDFIGLAWIAD